jgi:capsular polysaccharide biosynthesis protein
VATLTIEHRSNYFHFLCDAIARLQLIQNLKRPPDYIYVQGNLKYQAEILSRLGYQAHQIIDSSKYPFIQADELLVPSYVSNFSILTTNSISYLRSRLRKDSSLPPVSQGRIVFISRRDSPRRKLLNEDELLDQLSGFKVESVALSELSLDQQMELFEGADVVITTTGAGLANLIFARRELFLVLLTPPNWFGESALDVIKPFGLKFCNIAMSNYPVEADPYAPSAWNLTDQEIQSIVAAVTSLKQSGPAP